MALGNRIKMARECKGMSQGKLARLSDTGQATISALEKRDSEFSRHTSTLARVLGVNVAWLMDGEGPMEAGPGATAHPDEPAHGEGDVAPPAEGACNTSNEDMERVYQRLQKLRYRWVDLARELGTNNQSLYNWRTREGGLPKAYLVKTARFLGCSVDWLLTGEDSPTTTKTPITEGLVEAPEGASMHQMLDRLTKAHERIGQLESLLAQRENPKAEA